MPNEPYWKMRAERKGGLVEVLDGQLSFADFSADWKPPITERRKTDPIIFRQRRRFKWKRKKRFGGS